MSVTGSPTAADVLFECSRAGLDLSPDWCKLLMTESLLLPLLDSLVQEVLAPASHWTLHGHETLFPRKSVSLLELCKALQDCYSYRKDPNNSYARQFKPKTVSIPVMFEGISTFVQIVQLYLLNRYEVLLVPTTLPNRTTGVPLPQDFRYIEGLANNMSALTLALVPLSLNSPMNPVQSDELYNDRISLFKIGPDLKADIVNSFQAALQAIVYDPNQRSVCVFITDATDVKDVLLIRVLYRDLVVGTYGMESFVFLRMQMSSESSIQLHLSADLCWQHPDLPFLLNDSMIEAFGSYPVPGLSSLVWSYLLPAGLCKQVMQIVYKKV